MAKSPIAHDADAAWLKSFIDKTLITKPGYVMQMRELIEGTFTGRVIKQHEQRAEERRQPTAMQRARHITHYVEAVKHLNTCVSIVTSLTDCFEDTIYYVDGVRVNWVRRLLDYTAKEVEDLCPLLISWSGSFAAWEVEKIANAALAAGDILGAKVPAKVGVPETVVNVMRFALDLEAMADRIALYREHGGNNAGEVGTANDIAEWVFNAAAEVRTNIMAELLSENPSPLDLKLSRILAGESVSHVRMKEGGRE